MKKIFLLLFLGVFMLNANETNLFTYVENNDIQSVQTHIKNGENINLTNDSLYTPLMIAAKKGYLEIVKILVQAHANLDHQAKNGETALILAASHHNRDIVRYLIDNGANVNIRDNNRNTALTIAAKKGFPRISKMLRDAGGIE